MAVRSSTLVAGLTAAAVATVGFLAYQASANVPPGLAASEAATPAAARKAPRDRAHPAALPGNSGTGRRVVYSLDDDRVWLVGMAGNVERTFHVTPGRVDPPPGRYAVTSRSGRVTGTDGTPVEHVVRFATVDDVVIGFSAAVKSFVPAPDATVRTGGIRQTRPDGDAMWDFATIGQRVVVIR
ncbi:hypothetical protein [Streptomyces sp. DSM 15324]|uniref:hypothetical protein n=1 Tax=Streptomyces sp. DSM 15324 TaxID=1739111 RepID=UPI00074A8AD3|nr:hypothetical protein [Streptomyces sp. DSM 15324]KUO12064.1 hypothetical protein AQJ58_13085 [Streptomyces sp. DSM 15324]